MLKSSTGTDRSDQSTTCTSTAVAEALLTENSVVNPFGLFRSTSKYGSSSVAAGTASMVQITAVAGAPTDSNPANTRPIAIRDMSGPPLLFILDLRTILSSALFNDDAVTAYAVRRLLASPGGPAAGGSR